MPIMLHFPNNLSKFCTGT